MATPDTLEGLRARIAEGGPVLVLTGAGISAESGLATFRGPGGLWEGRDPMTLATPEAFAADPALVWRFYRWRRERAAAARPNAAHRAIAAFQARRPSSTLVTQNVDGLHERAGSEAVRLHGSLWILRCTAEGTEVEDRREAFPAFPPRCPCGALLRPGVVWFGEPLPREPLARAERAAREASVVLVVGTSGLVHPAASLPLRARRSGAYVVEINPDRTPLTPHVDARLEGPAGALVPRVLEAA